MVWEARRGSVMELRWGKRHPSLSVTFWGGQGSTFSDVNRHKWKENCFWNVAFSRNQSMLGIWGKSLWTQRTYRSFSVLVYTSVKWAQCAAVCQPPLCHECRNQRHGPPCAARVLHKGPTAGGRRRAPIKPAKPAKSGNLDHLSLLVTAKS